MSEAISPRSSTSSIVCTQYSQSKPSIIDTTPMDIGSSDLKMDDEINELLDSVQLDEYLKKRDDLEQMCYDYIGSVIVSSDLMLNTMTLYRGHNDFLIMSKTRDEVWVRGVITPNGFDLKFNRSTKKENKSVDGVYAELNEILLNEAVYRLNLAMK